MSAIDKNIDLIFEIINDVARHPETVVAVDSFARRGAVALFESDDPEQNAVIEAAAQAAEARGESVVRLRRAPASLSLVAR